MSTPSSTTRSRPLTGAERVARHKARQKAKPFLERYGYSSPKDLTAESKALEKAIVELRIRAEALNQALAKELESKPAGSSKRRALLALSTDRRIDLSGF